METWICGYVQRALGTARVWSCAGKEQRVYGGRLNVLSVCVCAFLVKAESGGYQTWDMWVGTRSALHSKSLEHTSYMS